MTRNTLFRLGDWGIYALFIVIVLGLPLVMDDVFWLNRIAKYLVYGMLGIAIALSWGYAGILNLGQGAKATEQLKDAKAQAAEIIEQAKKRANQLVDEETQKGHAEREKIIASGYAEIEAERNRAKEDLRKQVSALAVAGAQQILQREIDANAQNDIVEKLVAEL